MSEKQQAQENTNFLEQRIKMNEVAQTVDLNTWVFDKLVTDQKELNILELCCGTGKQTEFLMAKFPNAKITAVDISADAIEAIKKSSFYNAGRVQLQVNGIDEFLTANKDKKYDLVFVSYGLYYAKDIDQAMRDINTSLTENGRLVVVGPYGKNNGPLFTALQSIGVSISDYVDYSSSRFMYEKVLKAGTEMYTQISFNSTINRVPWKDKTQVINYWKNSIFYDQTYEAAFAELLDSYFSNNNAFVNEKHIGFIMLTK